MEVIITAVGAVTAVGRSALASAAAIRANITRPRPVQHFRVLDNDSQETVPLTGHPIHGFTEGFMGLGRWVRLARGALGDLLGAACLPPAGDESFWQQTAVLAVTAQPSFAFQIPPAQPEEVISRHFLQPLLQAWRLPVPPQRQRIVALGHGGTAAAVQQALQLLAGGLERVLVVAVDSLLEPHALRLLAGANRLKTADRPVGLMPGEAAVSFLLERAFAARRRGLQDGVVLWGAATGREENRVLRQTPNVGVGLAACIQQGLAVLPAGERFRGDVYLDLNGEEWRAREWGHALVRLRERLGDTVDHFPATAVGDTGAASGALGICLAVHDLTRGHGHVGHALVTSSSDLGDVGCVLLRLNPSLPRLP